MQVRLIVVLTPPFAAPTFPTQTMSSRRFLLLTDRDLEMKFLTNDYFIDRLTVLVASMLFASCFLPRCCGTSEP